MSEDVLSLRHGEILLEQAVAHAIDILIHLQHLAGALKVKSREALMDQVEHVTQNRRHLDELTYIGCAHF